VSSQHSPAVERRSVGRSGLRWPRLGIGCGPNAGLFVSAPEQDRRLTVQAALDAGINLFDTAAAYGDGISERNVGSTMKQLGAEAPALVTKVNIGVSEVGDIRGAVLRSVSASLERLGVSRLDAVMLHNRVDQRGDHDRIVGIGPLLSLDDVLGPRGFAAAVEELRASGSVGLAGFTAFGGDPPAIRELLSSGQFGAVNAEYNVLNPSAAGPAVSGQPDYCGVIDTAAEHGVGVMAIRVFGGGTLLGPADGARLAAVRRWCSQYGPSVAAGALRFVLSHPAVTTAVIGFTSPAHVQDALAALSAGPLPREAIQALAEISMARPSHEISESTHGG
jgi:aryl-alcohol dehydrogenase-like predicted oxidoreductase